MRDLSRTGCTVVEPEQRFIHDFFCTPLLLVLVPDRRLLFLDAMGREYLCVGRLRAHHFGHRADVFCASSPPPTVPSRSSSFLFLSLSYPRTQVPGYTRLLCT